MLFSVVVPVYNVERFLPECLESIINQSFEDYELILIDDGSSDSSSQICDEYQKRDERIKVIHKTNEGVSIARQVGVATCSGKYVTFVDSDDWIDNDFLLSFYNVIKKHSPDIICCNYVDSTGKNYSLKLPSGLYKKDKIISDIYPLLIHGDSCEYFPGMLWAKVFKRELYRLYEVKDVKIVMGEDGACVRPCVYNSNSMYILNKCLYTYRINTESVTRSVKSLPWDGPMLVCNHIRKHINCQEYDFEEQLNRYTVHALFNVAISRFSQKKPYNNIKKEIIENLEIQYYKTAIKKCHYSHINICKCAELVLKLKLIFVIYLAYLYKIRKK